MRTAPESSATSCGSGRRNHRTQARLRADDALALQCEQRLTNGGAADSEQAWPKMLSRLSSPSRAPS